MAFVSVPVEGRSEKGNEEAVKQSAPWAPRPPPPRTLRESSGQADAGNRTSDMLVPGVAGAGGV